MVLPTTIQISETDNRVQELSEQPYVPLHHLR